MRGRDADEMGNFCFVGRHDKMVIPRSLDELAASLEWEDTAVASDSSSSWLGVRARVASSTAAPWARAFLATPRMQEAGRGELFLYMVCCSGLSRAAAGGQLERRLLEEMRALFFSDSEYWQPSIPLRDIHNHVDEIFRLYHQSDLEADNVRKALRGRLLALRQDEAIRSGLEPAFAEFVKNRSFHPSQSHVMQQCIMSLL